LIHLFLEIYLLTQVNNKTKTFFMKFYTTPKFIIPIVLIFSIFALWLGSGIWIYNTFKPEIRGSIGDMFGAVNALFSGFALFGIIFTIYIQRKELGLQRIELADTRSEFQINRVTNVIYNQLKRIEEKLESNPFINPTQKSIPRTKFGYSFINELYTEKINRLYEEEDKDGRKLYEKTHSDTIFEITILENQSKLLRITRVIANSCEIIKKLTNIKSIEISNKKELQSIFFKNIETDLIKLIKVLDQYLTAETLNSLIVNNLDITNFQAIREHLNVILIYKNQDYKLIDTD